LTDKTRKWMVDLLGNTRLCSCVLVLFILQFTHLQLQTILALSLLLVEIYLVAAKTLANYEAF
jgi:hypothetical protein